MEINDLRQNRAAAEETVQIWDMIDETSLDSSESVKALAVSFLNQEGINLSDQNKAEVIQVIQVYNDMFLNWRKVIMGEELEPSEFASSIMGETVFLEVTNKFYRASKPVLSTIITDLKASMSVCDAIQDLKKRNVSDSLESEAEVMWHQYSKTYDMIPWVLFIATSNMPMLVTCKIFMSKVATAHKDSFINQYKATYS